MVGGSGRNDEVIAEALVYNTRMKQRSGGWIVS